MRSIWFKKSLRVPKRRAAFVLSVVAAVVMLIVSASSAIRPSSPSSSRPAADAASTQPASPTQPAQAAPTRDPVKPTPAKVLQAIQEGTQQAGVDATGASNDVVDPCSAPSGGMVKASTQQELVQRIVGVWLVCSQPTFFGTQEVGLQITSDGQWFKLYRNAEGQLVAPAADLDTGGWVVIDSSDANREPTFQLNFEFPAVRRTAIAVPTFATSVVRMHLDNMGVYAADYVPTTESVLPTNSEPPLPSSDPLANCSVPANGAIYPATQAEFVERITGTWLVCSQPTFFGSHEVGMQITSDGQWAKLYRNTDGQLVASSADQDRGTWDATAAGHGTYRLDFLISAIGRSANTVPVFAKAVTRMYLDNMGVHVANYVPTTESVVPASFEPPPPSSDPLANCSVPSNGAIYPATRQEFIAHIIGTWLVCSHPTIFGTQEVGVQITSDGRWFKLYRDAAGQLVAASSAQDRGTWAVIDGNSMSPPTFQLNFVKAAGGVIITVPVLARSVTRMYLDNMGVYAANYVPTTEQVVSA